MVQSHSKSVKGWLLMWKCSGIIAMLSVMLVTAVTVGAVILSKDVKLQIVSRDQWGANAPTEPLLPMNITPTPYVIICHTATEPCFTQDDCTVRVRMIQMFHRDSLDWDDIGYNFLIGGDGYVYEGRGWDNGGAHTIGFNYNSIGIALIGTFILQPPTKVQLKVAEMLIAYGIEKNKIDKNYKLLGARQVTSTESPGEILYSIIKKWDHWVPRP